MVPKAPSNKAEILLPPQPNLDKNDLTGFIEHTRIAKDKIAKGRIWILKRGA